MAEFRFRIPSHWKLNSNHLAAVHVVGLEGTPWPCKVRINRDQPESPVLEVSRNQNDSGRVYAIFPHSQRGEMLLCTGTLPESDNVYDLLKELARGTLNRLRDQVSIWEEGGLKIPLNIPEEISILTEILAKTILCDASQRQDEMAMSVIERGVDLIFEISDIFGQQIGSYRLSHPDIPDFWTGYTSSVNSPTCDAKLIDRFDMVRLQNPIFDIAALNTSIAQTSHSVVVGPWLDASANGLNPELLAIEDYEGRRGFLLKKFREFMESVDDRVQLIHLVAGINGIGHRQLGYPQQLQLTIDLIQLADEALIETPVMISFDFPWAERLAGAVGGIHPLQIADNLLRQGTVISYFGLEINLDYWPGGSVIRDPFQWIDLIDIWSQFDIPLIILFRCPSGGTPVDPDLPIDRKVNQQRSNLNEQQRIQLLKSVLPMLLARSAVRGIVFSQWQDADDSRFEFGGLVDPAGKPKPMFEIVEFLDQYLALQSRKKDATT